MGRGKTDERHVNIVKVSRAMDDCAGYIIDSTSTVMCMQEAHIKPVRTSFTCISTATLETREN